MNRPFQDQKSYSSSVFSDMSKASGNMIKAMENTPNRLARSCINPFKFVTRIPDNNPELTVLKSLTVAKNVKTINGEDLFVTIWNSRDRGIIRHYVADPLTKLYSFLEYIYPDQDLTSNYDRARPTTAGLQIYSGTTSGGTFNVSGSINATTVQRLPDLSTLKYENIVSYKTGTGNVLGNVPIENGVCALSMLQTNREFLPFKTNSVYPLDSVVKLDKSLDQWSSLWSSGVFRTPVSGEVIVEFEKARIPINTWGRIKINWTATMLSNVLTSDNFLMRVKANKADPTTGARTAVNYDKVFTILNSGLWQTFNIEEMFNVDEDVEAVQIIFLGGGTTGAQFKLTPNLVCAFDVQIYDVYQNFARGLATIIGTSNVGVGQTISLSGSFNYEAVPGSELNKDIGEIVSTADDSDDLEVMNMIYKKNKFNLNYTLKEYNFWVNSKNFEEDMSKKNIMMKADIWGDLIKPLGKFSSPLIGTLLGGLLGAPTVGRDFGNFIGDKVFSSTGKKKFSYASTKLENLPTVQQNIEPTLITLNVDGMGRLKDRNLYVFLVKNNEKYRCYKNGRCVKISKVMMEDMNGSLVKVVEIDTVCDSKMWYNTTSTPDEGVTLGIKRKEKDYMQASTKKHKSLDELLKDTFDYGREWTGLLKNNEDGTITCTFKYKDCKENIKIESDKKKKEKEKNTQCSSEETDTIDIFTDEQPIPILGDPEEDEYKQASTKEEPKVEKKEELGEEEGSLEPIQVKKPEVKIEMKLDEKPKPIVEIPKGRKWAEVEKPKIVDYPQDSFIVAEELEGWNPSTDANKQLKLNSMYSGSVQAYIESDKYPGWNSQNVVAINGNQPFDNVLILSKKPVYARERKTSEPVMPRYRQYTIFGLKINISGSFSGDLLRQVIRSLDASNLNYSKITNELFISTLYYERGVVGGSWGGAIYALINQFPYGPVISADLKVASENANDGLILGEVQHVNEKASIARDGLIVCCNPNVLHKDYVTSVYVTSFSWKTAETSAPRIFCVKNLAEMIIVLIATTMKNIASINADTDAKILINQMKDNLSRAYKSNKYNMAYHNYKTNVKVPITYDDWVKKYDQIINDKHPVMPKPYNTFYNVITKQIIELDKLGHIDPSIEQVVPTGNTLVYDIDSNGKRTGKEIVINAKLQVERAKMHKQWKPGEHLSWEPVPRKERRKQGRVKALKTNFKNRVKNKKPEEVNMEF